MKFEKMSEYGVGTDVLVVFKNYIPGGFDPETWLDIKLTKLNFGNHKADPGNFVREKKIATLLANGIQKGIIYPRPHELFNDSEKTISDLITFLFNGQKTIDEYTEEQESKGGN